MIKNERQYHNTKGKLAQFESALDHLMKQQRENPTELLAIQIAAVQSSVDELKEDLSCYDALKSGCLSVIDLKSLADIHKVLIMGRISRGWTQRDLAEKLKLKEQQIQRWEANDYESVNIHTIREILQVLTINITFEKIVFFPVKFDLGEDLRNSIEDAQMQIAERGNLFVIN